MWNYATFTVKYWFVLLPYMFSSLAGLFLSRPTLSPCVDKTLTQGSTVPLLLCPAQLLVADTQTGKSYSHTFPIIKAPKQEVKQGCRELNSLSFLSLCHGKSHYP